MFVLGQVSFTQAHVLQAKAPKAPKKTAPAAKEPKPPAKEPKTTRSKAKMQVEVPSSSSEPEDEPGNTADDEASP